MFQRRVFFFLLIWQQHWIEPPGIVSIGRNMKTMQVAIACSLDSQRSKARADLAFSL